MNSFWAQVIIHQTRNLKKQMERNPSYSDYVLAKGHRALIISLKRYLKDLALIGIGVFSAAFGFKGFLLSNHFIDGGATGISMLLTTLFHFPLSYVIILLNIPFIILGYQVIGKNFAIKTILAITGLSLCLTFISFPNVTNDNLLVSVFGGTFLGAGIGLSIRGGAVIDGTEVLALFLSKKFRTRVGDIILFFNILIFSVAAYSLGIEIALYSMITYLAASKTLNFIVEGIDEFIGVTIVSVHSEEVRHMIIHTLKRNVTIYPGKYEFGKKSGYKDIEILFTVITRLELNRLETEIEKIEPTAFLVMHPVKDIKSGIIKSVSDKSM